MRQFLVALFFMQCTMFVYAQTDKIVKLTESGTLSYLIGEDIANISKLTITGTNLSQSDFIFLKKMLIDYNLQEIDMEKTLTSSIPQHAFEECTNLKAFKLPVNLYSIGRSAFYGCKGLTEVNIPFSVQNLAEMSFRDCLSLKKVTIGKNVQRVGGQAFLYCNNLTEIHCSSPTPPFCEYASFEYLHENIILYVPEGSKKKYSLSEGWVYFKNIVEEQIDVSYSVRISYNEGGSVFCLYDDMKDDIVIVDKNASIALGIYCDVDRMASIETVTFNGIDVSSELITDFKMNKYFITPSITIDSEFNVVFGLGQITSTADITSPHIKLSTRHGIIQIDNVEPNEVISVYTMSGLLLEAVKSTGKTISIAVPQKQVYIVKVSDKIFKVLA